MKSLLPVKNRHGIAVLITLTVIVLLMTTVMELNRKVGSAADMTGVIHQKITLAHMASSAVQVGMGMLVRDKNESDNVDSLQEEWADATITEQALQEFPFEEGTLTLVISDELSRIQVNALVNFPEGQTPNEPQFQMWLRFLRYIRPMEGLNDDDTSPMAIVDSMKDWLDSGDDDAISGASGAESDYYQDLETPYRCQNGPMRHVSELLLVKGVRKLLEAVDSSAFIWDYLTVHGMIGKEGEGQGTSTYPGKININTASLPVIAALLPDGENPSLAQAIVEYRDEMSGGKFVHDLTSPDWYRSAPGLGDITIEPDLITIQSDCFRIMATAELHGVKQTTIAVVEREKNTETGKWQCRVLSWEME
ncbi:MAG: general secretion pathway protein GspK [Thermodesulfobacteriota bacterium]